jgi:hypothetical protein
MPAMDILIERLPGRESSAGTSGRSCATHRLEERETTMHRRTTSVATIILLTICAPAWADNAVTRWVEQALQTVRAQSLSTPAAGRLYAMVTVAMYDAVNGIDRARHLSTREHALVPAHGAPALGDRRVAAAAAAHAVLISFAAAGSSQATALDTALASELQALADLPPQLVAAGQTWGAEVGRRVVALRATDGTAIAETQPAGTAPGEFRLAFTGAQFRRMAPFGVESLEPYKFSPPPDLSSVEYAAAFNDVKTFGDVNDPDPTRTAIAKQWQAEGNTARETGLWLKAALDVVERWGTVQSLSHTARLFALLGMGVADAVAASWGGKYDFHLWRPGDAIREAETDGNPDTDADSMWTPRNLTFGTTPESPSGTATFAGAASRILAGFYCWDRVPFSFAGEQPGALPRHYTSFSKAADEAGRSRIYHGIHFEFSNQSGRQQGDLIGKEIVTTRLRRAGRCFGILCACPQL